MKKNTKICLIIIIILVITIGIFISKKLYSSYSWVDDYPNLNDGYRYIRKNMNSHHYLTNHSDEVGVFLMKSGDPSLVSGKSYPVYCAQAGVDLGGESYNIVELTDSSVPSGNRNNAGKLRNTLIHSYPYMSLADLKTYLKNNMAQSVYNEYEFDTLDVQEAISATQAAIWNIAYGSKRYEYDKTASVASKTYKNFHKAGDASWTIDWNSEWAYNITEGCYNGYGSNLGCGAKSTILQDGDTTSSVASYKSSGTTHLADRINALIDFYMNLPSMNEEALISNASFRYKNDTWDLTNNTLTVKIIGKNFSYNGTNYNITFKDENDGVLNIIETTPIQSNNIVTGYQYKVSVNSNNKVKAVITANVESDNLKTMYAYNSTYQDFIFATKQKINIEKTITITRGTLTQVKIKKSDLSNASCLAGALLTIKNSSGEVVDSWTSSCVNGEDTHSVELVNGRYTLTEDQAPIGYATSETISFEISEGELEKNIEMKDAPTKVCLKDLDKESNEYIENAKLKILNSDGTTYKDITTSNEICIIKIPIGEYIIREVEVPDGYLPFDDIRINVEDTSNKQDFVIKNEKTKVCFEKTSTFNENLKLTGSVFHIKDSNDNLIEEFEMEDETTCIQGLKNNSYYYLVEVTPPINYIKSYDIYKFKVGSNNSNTVTDYDRENDVKFIEKVNNKVVIKNKPGVAFTKSDLTTGLCVTGAKLTIKDMAGNIMDSWTSSCEEGKDTHSISLEPNDYIFTEELAPVGYATSESIKFKVNEEGFVDSVLDMKDGPLTLCIYSIGKDNNELLDGSEVKIYKEDGSLFYTLNTSSTKGNNCISYIPIGNYVIEETKVSGDYELTNKKYNFSVVDKTEVQELEIMHEVKAPKTSKNKNNIVSILSMILLGLFGLVTFTYIKYKNKKKILPMS